MLPRETTVNNGSDWPGSAFPPDISRPEFPLRVCSLDVPQGLGRRNARCPHGGLSGARDRRDGGDADDEEQVVPGDSEHDDVREGHSPDLVGEDDPEADADSDAEDS